ncbi:hypothetical protein SODALDRAFT_357133 [Sodiomyces alkalinus F11]|uniref:Uncharacterized protein n=1 Tax=Sodiomyces alkalinus (strain CBS 110278 / VKM F-3762 / F11) TaxID=1314773 RepID=A0A3N2Q310_SODAK|nr:hypothetical protein SODALDRAFT_357133 [Sodiomyces alkalinus F11]ROT41107.1 hypothetical protein SODALDRAFT_357133 [Sodiomyces alkalinus F11]
MEFLKLENEDINDDLPVHFRTISHPHFHLRPVSHTEHIHTKMVARAATKAVTSSVMTTRVLPTLMMVGADQTDTRYTATAVGSFVRSQLKQQSTTLDRYFARSHTPEREATRARVFEGAPDPRKSIFNVLSW